MPTYDCTANEPLIPFNPVYFPCWGLKALPDELDFSATASTLIPPNTSCNTGWPTTNITGKLTRTGPCDFVWAYSSGSFGILFAWTVGGPPKSCSPDQAELFPNWSLDNLTGDPVSGSCYQIGDTGVTSLTFTGTISDVFCKSKITVTYNG